MLLEKNTKKPFLKTCHIMEEKIDRINDLTLYEIETTEYHTIAHINPPLTHPLNPVILTESESLVNIFESWNNIQNITLNPLDMSGVEGTTSMQPQMVARGYQNALGITNTILGSNSGGNPLSWNVNIPRGNNASWSTNDNWIFP